MKLNYLGLWGCSTRIDSLKSEPPRWAGSAKNETCAHLLVTVDCDSFTDMSKKKKETVSRREMEKKVIFKGYYES